jgi:hypothetical protein
MRFHWKAAVAVSVVCGFAVHRGGGDRQPVQPISKPPEEVLRRVKMSPHVEAIRNRLAGLMVVRDPVTGELRAPEPECRRGYSRCAPRPNPRSYVGRMAAGWPASISPRSVF